MAGVRAPTEVRVPEWDCSIWIRKPTVGDLQEISRGGGTETEILLRTFTVLACDEHGARIWRDVKGDDDWLANTSPDVVVRIMAEAGVAGSSPEVGGEDPTSPGS